MISFLVHNRHSVLFGLFVWIYYCIVLHADKGTFQQTYPLVKCTNLMQTLAMANWSINIDESE